MTPSGLLFLVLIACAAPLLLVFLLADRTNERLARELPAIDAPKPVQASAYMTPRADLWSAAELNAPVHWGQNMEWWSVARIFAAAIFVVVIL